MLSQNGDGKYGRDIFHPFAQYRMNKENLLRHSNGFRNIKVKWSKAYERSQMGEL